MSLEWNVNQISSAYVSAHEGMFASKYGVFLSPKLQKGVSIQRQTPDGGW